MTLSRWCLALVVSALGLCRTPAAELPQTVASAPCRVAPTIDGVIGDDEWQAARAIDFDLKLVWLKPPATESRACRLWVMNSANALYLALRVPDETINNRLSPFDVDGAVLAFCRGKEVAPGDDRKALAAGLYVDKHVAAPGKDADDRRQDGRGAMVHRKGVYTLEWAVPLNSGDKEDIRVKPGDPLRFNLAYYDGLQADLKNTRFGFAYGPNLDRAAGWGTLQLAADVVDDGGTAFKGPAWVDALFQSFRHVPANRLRLKNSALVPGQLRPAVKVNVEYTYRNPRGKEATGQAKLYLPAAVKDGKSRVPLFVAAGYELDDRSAAGHVQRGFAVVTPSGLEANPLVRTANPDVALLHIARSLPFVDDSRVLIGGGSAGGYITLLLAAETFPLAAAVPAVPPVNLGYNAAYFLQRKKQGKAATDAGDPKVPVFNAIVPIIEQAVKAYGPDPGDQTWYRHAPLAHLPTITCPVAVYFSTADVLVPIDQVGSQWVRPFDPKAFPAHFTMDPEKLTATREGRLRLVDVLPASDYELFVLTEDQVKGLAPKSGAKALPEMPFSRSKQWSIVILDEGQPEPLLGHVKYPVAWSNQGFLTHVTTGQVPVGQLTLAKLERLMDRYAGKEWLPTELKHLDYPESERADVVRGLKRYVAAGPENARRFEELYGKLPPDKRVLDAAVWK